MKPETNLTSADLFCGAGGTSTGILQAARDMKRRMDLLAVNHWDTAINTHSLNHPGVRHICDELEKIDPRKSVPSGKLDLLAASPECTGHSIAAGGMPRNPQSRATADFIIKWARRLDISNIMIENVREFMQYGPLGSNRKPLKRQKGKFFNKFIADLQSLGYFVEHRILNAADYGDPTSRRRLIILCRKGKQFAWPKASHGAIQRDELFNDELQPYRTAREIIDWDLKGKSIFNRTKPLSENTMRRIAAGLRKFGGANAEPFLVMLYGTNDARSVNRPVPTVTANGGHIGLADPFLVNMKGKSNASGLDTPSPTITAHASHLYLAEPFIVGVNHGRDPKPRGTDGRRTKSIDEPMPAITTQPGYGLCEPFITHTTHTGQRRPISVDEPCPTITGAHRGEMALIEPFVLPQNSSNNPKSIDAPVPTIMTDGCCALVQPFLVKYYGTANANSIEQPLATVTTKDRFMLVEPKTGKVIAELDILFRMLQPHELAAAMSFPKNYKFTGNRGDQVKQIGNAVPVKLARACAMALLTK